MVYILSINYHYDDGKRAEGYGYPEALYRDREAAYRAAVLQTCKYAVEVHEDPDSLPVCLEFLSRIKAEGLTWEEAYDSYDGELHRMFGETGEFTMQPTSTWYTVKWIHMPKKERPTDLRSVDKGRGAASRVQRRRRRREPS